MKPAPVYLDTSAVLRVLLGQKGARAPLQGKAIAVSSELVEVEAYRSLENAHRARKLGDLELAHKTRELLGLTRAMHLFPVSEQVLRLARASFPIAVRTLDALHVATAQVVLAEAPDLELWTHDPLLGAAAMTRGLQVRGLPGERA